MGRLFVLALVGASACKRAPEAKPLTLDDGKGKTHECKLVAGGRIQQDTAIEAACQVTIAEPYTVTKGATLRIGSGSRLAFKKGAYLLVQDGALIVEGTKEAPVVMTSAEAKPATGDWGGLLFASDKPSSIAGAVVEYASGDPGNAKLADGGDAGVSAKVAKAAALADAAEFGMIGLIGFGGSGPRGDFRPVAGRKPSLYLLPGARLTLTDVTVRHGGKVGVAADGDDPFVRVEKLHLEDLGGIGMDVRASALGKVVSISGPEPVRVRGSLHESQTWPKIEAGLLVASLDVHAKDKEQVALLTLAVEQIVRVEPGANLSFGGYVGGGGLVASKAIFTSAAPKPAAGDWSGLRFSRRAAGTRIDGCVVEHSGHGEVSKPITFGSTTKAKEAPPPKPAALQVDEWLKDFQVVRTTFRNNAGPGMGKDASLFGSGSGGCEGLDAPKNDNKSVGQPSASTTRLSPPRWAARTSPQRQHVGQGNRRQLRLRRARALGHRGRGRRQG
ncbi:MAG: hypothetical protein IPJ34_08195 [Myxococcales bacterium]|nr:hypothetical protein [Myxococcales bacterium]